MAKSFDQYRVAPGRKAGIARRSTDETPGFNKSAAGNRLEENIAEIAALQDKLYAQNTQSLLLVFQAMDAAGKDGTIRHVLSGVNPAGCHTTSFKAPSGEERDHDFLWRCTRHLPAKGMIGIFNRSYYEEVLIVRVIPAILQGQQLPPEILNDKDIWKKRLEDIRNLEEYLARNGTHVLKFFLNVSKAEQAQRFMDRIDQPDKNWKFSLDDLRQREHWDKYMSAFEDAISATSTDAAPWHVIPADKKWYARLAVSEIIREKLESLKLAYPVVSDEQKKQLEEGRALLQAELKPAKKK